MRLIWSRIKLDLRVHNKLLLLFWIFVSTSFTSFLIKFWIILHFLAFLKFIIVLIYKEELKSWKLLDKIIIKALILLANRKNIKKIDLICLITMNYLIIFLFNCSLKSILLSCIFYKEIKLAIFSKEFELKTVYKRVLKRAFDIKNVQIKEIKLGRYQIKISHSNNNDL